VLENPGAGAEAQRTRRRGLAQPFLHVENKLFERFQGQVSLFHRRVGTRIGRTRRRHRDDEDATCACGSLIVKVLTSPAHARFECEPSGANWVGQPAVGVT
jgi:hypothetical protein